MARVTKILGDALKNSKSLMGAQFAVEKMELAIKQGTINAVKVVDRANRVLKQLVEREKAAKALKIDLSSEWKKLHDIYENELSEVTMEELETLAYEQQSRVVKFASERQLGIIKEWCKKRAEVTVAEIKTIHDVLVAKGFKIASNEIEKAGVVLFKAAQEVLDRESEEKEKNKGRVLAGA